MIKTPDILLLIRENIGKLYDKLVYVSPESDPFAFKIDAVQKIMANYIDGFLKAIKNKTMCIEPGITKSVKHRRTLIKRDMATFEYAAGTSRLVALIYYSDFHPAFCQQTGRRQS